jgi:hypothetical protein
MKTEQERELENLSHISALTLLRLTKLKLWDRRKKPLLKTRDLVNLLLGQSSRASLPRVMIKLSTQTPEGKKGVRLSCPIV